MLPLESRPVFQPLLSLLYCFQAAFSKREYAETDAYLPHLNAAQKGSFVVFFHARLMFNVIEEWGIRLLLQLQKSPIPKENLKPENRHTD
ncbi:hypothetical protein DWW46_02890 [Sutterella sp. AF15-45LB]|nr:hypothetical protein DWW46_02890 [Sutterella sp. AF15-45LB]RGU80586.1 hypothetical protein DWW45_02890 [Sutterella sp. AF15-44LB]